MESKKFTAQELIDCANDFSDTSTPYWISADRWDEMVEMLRQASDMRKIIDRLCELINYEICYPSESNCKKCLYRKGSDCGCKQNNRMLYLIKVAKGEAK